MNCLYHHVFQIQRANMEPSLHVSAIHSKDAGYYAFFKLFLLKHNSTFNMFQYNPQSDKRIDHGELGSKH